MKSIAVIPARIGSKGIPKKNIKLLNGIPLIAYTIKSAIASTLDRVVVSTDSEIIGNIANDFGAEVIVRPSEIAKYNTPTLPVIQHAVQNLKEKYDYIVTLQPTSPLRNQKHIDDAMNVFHKRNEADSLVSVTKVPHNMNPESIMRLDKNGYLVNYIEQDQLVLRRQDKQNYVARNGASIYITKGECLDQFIFGGRIMPYFMDYFHSIDIDDESDFLLAEIIIKAKSQVEAL